MTVWNWHALVPGVFVEVSQVLDGHRVILRSYKLWWPGAGGAARAAAGQVRQVRFRPHPCRRLVI